MKQKNIIITVGVIILLGIGSFLIWRFLSEPASSITLIPNSGADLAAAKQVMEKRIDAWGLQGIDLVLRHGKLILRSSTAHHPVGIIVALIQPGLVEIIDGGIEYPPVDSTIKIKTGAIANPDQEIYQALLNPEDFLFSEARPEGGQTFWVRVTLTEAGAFRLQEFLDNNQGVYLCLVLDKEVQGCPIMKLAGQTLDILPGATPLLVEDGILSGLIASGPLAVEFELAD